MLPEIFVVTTTNREKRYLKNIANNFLRQKYPHKKLCVIINSNYMTVKEVHDILVEHGISDAVIDHQPNITTGLCLNISMQLMPHTSMVWAKMDDDDIYGADYLVNKIYCMIKSNSPIVGQIHMISYIPEKKVFRLRKEGPIFKHTTWVRGATFVILKTVFDKVQFQNVKQGSDSKFLEDARSKNISIYAGNVNDFINIRHVDPTFHTWKEAYERFIEKTNAIHKNDVYKLFKDIDYLLENHVMN